MLIRWVFKSGKLITAEVMLTVLFYVFITLANISLGTIRTPTASFYIFWGTMVGLMFGLRGVLIAAGIGSMSVLGLILAQNAGILPLPDYRVGFTQWFNFTAIIGMTASLAYYVHQNTQKALARSEKNEERLRLLSENAKDVIWTMEPNGTISYISAAVEKVRGYTPEEAMRQPIEEILLPASQALSLNYFKKVIEDIQAGRPTEQFREELEYHRKDGSIFHADVIAYPIIDAAGNLVQIVGVSRDIDERKRHEQALAQHKAIIDSTGDAIISHDLQGNITSWNSAAERLYGYLAKEVIGQSISLLVHEDSKEDLAGLMKRVRQGEIFLHHRVYRLRKDGRQIPVLLSLSPIRNLQGEVIGTSSVGHDISEQVRLEQQVREMAFHDALTNLANRRLLDDRINLSLASNRRSRSHSALLYIDLDNFKPLNDTHGHEAGDMLLQEVAKRLKSNIRAVDTVSRVGGDEFVVLITDLEKEKDIARQHALAIAEKIRLSLEEPYVLETRQQQTDLMVAHICSASIGVVLFSETKKSQEELLKEADVAMYEAKHAGRNAVRFYQSKD